MGTRASVFFSREDKDPFFCRVIGNSIYATPSTALENNSNCCHCQQEYKWCIVWPNMEMCQILTDVCMKTHLIHSAKMFAKHQTGLVRTTEILSLGKSTNLFSYGSCFCTISSPKLLMLIKNKLWTCFWQHGLHIGNPNYTAPDQLTWIAAFSSAVFLVRPAYWWLTPKVCSLPTQPIPASFIFIYRFVCVLRRGLCSLGWSQSQRPIIILCPPHPGPRVLGLRAYTWLPLSLETTSNTKPTPSFLPSLGTLSSHI